LSLLDVMKSIVISTFSGPWKGHRPPADAKPLRVDPELGPQGQADHVDPTRKLPLSARGVGQSQEIFGPHILGTGADQAVLHDQLAMTSSTGSRLSA
jgi:hypothetical protein